ncbi:MAG: hypothetical protein KDD63_24315 [Bacteroidetes bacterium]|nr:hypothetical protein [Bacteroidota bacterium]
MLKQLFITLFLILPLLTFSQQIKNVPQAFNSLNPDPEVITLTNKIKVPKKRGHFQGVQVIEQNGSQKLIISGSSRRKAYLLQADLTKKKAEKLITLMTDPYRHAGGFQVDNQYLIVGIEDNIAKTSSKVCLFNYLNENLEQANPTLKIDRAGEPKRYSAGATGLMAIDTNYLLLVTNWDSRDWDFYEVNPETGEYLFLKSFHAPGDWGSYQATNLLRDDEAIYAIGFYQGNGGCQADLILVSKLDDFNLIMEKMATKIFSCQGGVDFSGAAGLEVDREGKLSVWGTQKNTGKKIVLNKFSSDDRF